MGFKPVRPRPPPPPPPPPPAAFPAPPPAAAFAAVSATGRTAGLPGRGAWRAVRGAQGVARGRRAWRLGALGATRRQWGAQGAWRAGSAGVERGRGGAGPGRAGLQQLGASERASATQAPEPLVLPPRTPDAGPRQQRWLQALCRPNHLFPPHSRRTSRRNYGCPGCRAGAPAQGRGARFAASAHSQPSLGLTSLSLSFLICV